MNWNAWSCTLARLHNSLRPCRRDGCICRIQAEVSVCFDIFLSLSTQRLDFFLSMGYDWNKKEVLP